MVQAAPLEEHLSGLEVEFLGDPIPHRAVLRAADRGEIRWRRNVGRQERGILRSDEEFMQVAPVPVACPDPVYLDGGRAKIWARAEGLHRARARRRRTVTLPTLFTPWQVQ